MSSINSHLGMYNFLDANAASNVANLEQKQTWLNELEKSGLSEALNKMKVVKSEAQEDFQPISDNRDESSHSNNHSPVGNELLNQRANIRSVVALNSETPKQPTVLSVEILSNVNQEITYGLITLPNTMTDDREYLDKKVSTEPSVVKMDNLNTILQWSLRNISILRANDGIELWVRDQEMTDNRLIGILQNLQQNMGLLGASLVKVVLNGQEVFAAKRSKEIKTLS